MLGFSCSNPASTRFVAQARVIRDLLDGALGTVRRQSSRHSECENIQSPYFGELLFLESSWLQVKLTSKTER
jgi:hypothetical protein